VALSASGLLFLTFGFVYSSDATWHSPVVAASVAAGVAVLVVFFVWEHRAAFPMVPPALLRTSSFGRASAVYLLAYLAFSGFIYYVTLFFQNVDGWSALRTGLSWLSSASRTLPWPSSASGSSGGCRWHRPSGGGASSPPRVCLA
jgi:hypothetical protein